MGAWNRSHHHQQLPICGFPEKGFVQNRHYVSRTGVDDAKSSQQPSVFRQKGVSKIRGESDECCHSAMYHSGRLEESYVIYHGRTGVYI
jgi:hypothetical protein